MKKRLGILVVLLFGVVMIAYGFYTIKEEKEEASQVLEKEIEMMLVEIDNNISVYIETYENMMEDLLLSKEMLYHTQESYKGFTHMEATQVLHPELEYIYYGSETGEMLLRPETELPEDYDPRARPWYKGALNSEKVVWSNPYMNSAEGHMTLSGALQVLDDQQLNGVLGMDIELDQNIFFSKKEISRAYEIIVVSDGGSIIHHEDADFIGLLNVDGEISQGIYDGSSTFEYVPYRTVLDIEQTNLESNQTMFVESKDERTAFVRTNHLGWSIILTVSTDDIK